LPELVSRCFTIGTKKSDTISDCESEEDNGQLLSLADDVMIDPSQEDGIAEQSTSLPDLVEDAEFDLVEDEEDNGLWCYCRQDEHYDVMIACDGENCAIE